MIIVAVLGVLTVLLIMVTNLSADASFALQMMATLREQDRTYYVAQSAVNAVLPLLPDSSSGANTLQDAWAIGAPPLKIDGYIVKVTISDEERFINPNAMLNGDGVTTNNDQVNVFRRLVRSLGQSDEEISNAILDWIDSDSNRRMPGGAEGTDYGERLPKNAPLDSIDEISNIIGIPPELLSGVAPHKPGAGATGGPGFGATGNPGTGATSNPGPSPSSFMHSGMSGGFGGSAGGQVKHGLREFISVYSTGTINVNTAPPYVLQSLDDNLDQGLVNAIVQQRDRQPFKSLDDMNNVPGLGSDHIYQIKKVADVKSTTWAIRADVGIDTGTLTLEGPPETTLIGIYRGNGQGTVPLAWNLEEVGSSSAEASPSPSASPSSSPSPTAFPSALPSGSPAFGGSSGAQNPSPANAQKF